jgi:hypothetical protein
MNRGTSLLSLVATVALTGGVVTGGILSFEDNMIRSQAARARVNMAELARGIEAYAVDWGVYPYDGYNYVNASSGEDRYEYWYPPRDLTTPVCYVAPQAFEDPFRMRGSWKARHWQYNHLRYAGTDATWGDIYDQLVVTSGVSAFYDEVLEEWGRWRIHSVGPDRSYGPSGWEGVTTYPAGSIPYDPTNGSISAGDLIHSQLSSVGYLNIPQS